MNGWLKPPPTLRNNLPNTKSNSKLTPDTIQKAKDGDVASILELKRLAKEGNERAQAVLEPLYYDGNKKYAVCTIILPEGLTYIRDNAFYKCNY